MGEEKKKQDVNDLPYVFRDPSPSNGDEIELLAPFLEKLAGGKEQIDNL